MLVVLIMTSSMRRLGVAKQTLIQVFNILLVIELNSCAAVILLTNLSSACLAERLLHFMMSMGRSFSGRQTFT